MAVRVLSAWEALPSMWDKPRRLQLFSALRKNSFVVEGGRQTKHRCFGIEVAGMALSPDAFSSSDLLMPSHEDRGELRPKNYFALASHITPPAFSYSTLCWTLSRHQNILLQSKLSVVSDFVCLFV